MNAVCYFGSYYPQYSRNKILIDGLKKNGVAVYECQSSHGSFLERYPDLINRYWSIRRKVDVIIVGFCGQLDMPLAWILSRLTKKKVVFDMFYSMYDTYVFDRQSAKPGSLNARRYFWIDKLAATLADVIITDTWSHSRYFVRTFGLNSQKFHRIFVGGDDTLFFPVKKKSRKKIIVEFHGMFTQLQGAEYFVEAAKLLENEKKMEFWLIGDSTHYFLPFEKIKILRPKTLKYYRRLSLKKLADKVASSTISVGHLGLTDKAKNVISNKIYEAVFCKIPVIVADTPAVCELLQDSQTAVFTKAGNPKDLAFKIKLLAKNQLLQKKISNKAFILAQKKLTNKKLGKELIDIIIASS